MQSPCIEEASQACFHGCCPAPFHGTRDYLGCVAAAQLDFAVATASSLFLNTQFTNHESLPSLSESVSGFTKAYPQYLQTEQADHVRAGEYCHLSLSEHVCLDYIGHGLFSYSQLQDLRRTQTTSVASTSSFTPGAADFTTSGPPFFDILYKSVKLNSQILYGGEESELESKIKSRIMGFMNVSEDDYTMVFTANQSSAFKLLADFYPFESHPNLLTVYDYESEAVEVMTESSKKRGARVTSAEFLWPDLRIHSEKLRKKMVSKRRKKKRRGLFVFPLQSRMTGARYSFLWMTVAQENGWHVLLDACALGAKDMETLGLSLFKPDFLICSFFKVFGENPSGFACLFVKKSCGSVLTGSDVASTAGIVSIVPASRASESLEETAKADAETQRDNNRVTASFSGPISTQKKNDESPELPRRPKAASFSEIVELELQSTVESSPSEINGSGTRTNPGLECKGLDHADALGLILISSRARFLINWLVNALMSLQHPHSETPLPAVRIYGPKIRFDRGPAVAFNVLDWKGQKIDPVLVQKLADRNNISLSYGFLRHVSFSDSHEEERERALETVNKAEGRVLLSKKRLERFHSRIPVVTAFIGFLTNFEDTYRLWAFISRFLDADYVEKERWRYRGLNQKTIEI